ncbi:hypothetical protein AB0D49_32165 [Streptomyces sp. NPDC048290]|uniref:hypothetical protein n=1 Tax=Streptomyces sp. NPDC048290 TaxID=3155811 RepID=UPI00341D0758
MTRPSPPSRPAVGSRVRAGLGAAAVCATAVCATALAGVTGAGAGSGVGARVAYAAVGSYPGADRAPVSRAVPSDPESRAGSVPGEGRRRPGRTEATATAAEGDPGRIDETAAEGDQGAGDPLFPRHTPYSSSDPAPYSSASSRVPEGADVAGSGRRAGPAPRILPLGGGLMLIGLGLGFAFLGLRLRRE